MDIITEVQLINATVRICRQVASYFRKLSLRDSLQVLKLSSRKTLGAYNCLQDLKLNIAVPFQ